MYQTIPRLLPPDQDFIQGLLNGTISPLGFRYEMAPSTPATMEERLYLPTLLYKLVGVPIKSAKLVGRVGRVGKFDVTPLRSNDPPLLVCTEADFSEYYPLWGAVFQNSSYDWKNYNVQWRKMIEDVLHANSKILTQDELKFFYLEALTVQNRYLE